MCPSHRGWGRVGVVLVPPMPHQEPTDMPKLCDGDISSQRVLFPSCGHATQLTAPHNTSQHLMAPHSTSQHLTAHPHTRLLLHIFPSIPMPTLAA